jgi:hypothetical protein
MHDAKTVAFAQHFLKIGEPVTVRVRMALPLPSPSPVLCKVFGRQNDETLRTLSWLASKKRQGTKSREVWHGLGSERLWGFDAGADRDGGCDAGRM